MAVVSVMYPATPGAKFDLEYYLHTHMKMVQETWSPAGMRGYQVLQGAGGPDGSAPTYHIVANLDFTSAAAFAEAVAQSGAKIMGDIPNFTDIQPIIQISDIADAFGTGSST